MSCTPATNPCVAMSWSEAAQDRTGEFGVTWGRDRLRGLHAASSSGLGASFHSQPGGFLSEIWRRLEGRDVRGAPWLPRRGPAGQGTETKEFVCLFIFTAA